MRSSEDRTWWSPLKTGDRETTEEEMKLAHKETPKKPETPKLNLLKLLEKSIVSTLKNSDLEPEVKEELIEIIKNTFEEKIEEIEKKAEKEEEKEN